MARVISVARAFANSFWIFRKSFDCFQRHFDWFPSKHLHSVSYITRVTQENYLYLMISRTHYVHRKLNLASTKKLSHPKPSLNECGMQSPSHVNVQLISEHTLPLIVEALKLYYRIIMCTIIASTCFTNFSNAFFPIIEPHFGEYIFSYSTSSTWLEKLT